MTPNDQRQPSWTADPAEEDAEDGAEGPAGHERTGERRAAPGRRP